MDNLNNKKMFEAAHILGIDENVIKLCIEFRDASTKGESKKVADFFNDTLAKYPQNIQEKVLEQYTTALKIDANEAKFFPENIIAEKLSTEGHIRSIATAAITAKKVLGDKANKQLSFIADEFSKMTSEEYKKPESVIKIYKQSNAFKK